MMSRDPRKEKNQRGFRSIPYRIFDNRGRLVAETLLSNQVRKHWEEHPDHTVTWWGIKVVA